MVSDCVTFTPEERLLEHLFPDMVPDLVMRHLPNGYHPIFYVWYGDVLLYCGSSQSQADLVSKPFIRDVPLQGSISFDELLSDARSPRQKWEDSIPACKESQLLVKHEDIVVFIVKDREKDLDADSTYHVWNCNNMLYSGKDLKRALDAYTKDILNMSFGDEDDDDWLLGVI